MVGKNIRTFMLLMALLFCDCAFAKQRIAILNFELNDITSLPNTKQEQQRTATIRPLLEQEIQKLGDFEIIQIDAQSQAAANSSFGYLFRFHDLAAKIGHQFGADWVIVGQHSKPSFLFSYLMVHVVNVKTQSLATGIDIEMKGNHEKVTQRSVMALAKKISLFIE